MTRNPSRQDNGVSRVLRLLRNRYGDRHVRAEIDVYRYNPAAIRVRIVDPDFADKSIAEREAEVWPIFDELPESLAADITVCLLITPEEKSASIMSLEFDHPSPSTL